MKKIYISLFIVFFCLCGCSSNTSNTENGNYNAERTSSGSEQNNSSLESNKSQYNNVIFEEVPYHEEIDLSSFSTKIYTPNDSARQNNISITCSNLNETIVEPGQTFSFCDTVGQATSDRGYQKADIFDANGNVKKGYGGGNCQISSTLYNAVLGCENLEIVERHEHSRKVYYVEDGMDAAVAYGSIDFKFKNNNSYSIKIYASNTTDSVDIRIVKI